MMNFPERQKRKVSNKQAGEADVTCDQPETQKNSISENLLGKNIFYTHHTQAYVLSDSFHIVIELN